MRPKIVNYYKKHNFGTKFANHSNMKNYLLICCISFVTLVACMHTKKSQTSWNKEDKIQPEAKEQYPQAEIRELASTTNPFKILKAEIIGDYMEFEVSYTGGCETHEFKLVGSPILTKSLPPIRNIQLEHNNKGDKCKAIKTEKLKFAIPILSNNYSKNKIKLLLLNNQQTFEYSYSR